VAPILRTMPRFLELCSGTAVMSAKMRALGWETVTVDIDERYKPDIVGDVTSMLRSFEPGGFDVVFGAPPCDDFTRWSMPWIENKSQPSMDVPIAVASIIHRINPKLWFVENVNGAKSFFQPLFGDVKFSYGRSWFLWGSNLGIKNVPVSVAGRNKENKNGSGLRRASYAPAMVDMVCEAIDRVYRGLV